MNASCIVMRSAEDGGNGRFGFIKLHDILALILLSHNPKIVDSNLAPANKKINKLG